MTNPIAGIALRSIKMFLLKLTDMCVIPRMKARPIIMRVKRAVIPTALPPPGMGSVTADKFATNYCMYTLVLLQEGLHGIVDLVQNLYYV